MKYIQYKDEMGQSKQNTMVLRTYILYIIMCTGV